MCTTLRELAVRVLVSGRPGVGWVHQDAALVGADVRNDVGDLWDEMRTWVDRFGSL